VVTECREDGHTIVARQRLQIRDGDQEIAVREFPLGPLPSFTLCYQFAQGRLGTSSVAVLPFQRLGISPDGSTVVFEVTDDHSILAPLLPLGLLPPGEEEGIFAVRVDGSELRRLGDASRSPSFLFTTSPSTPGGIFFYLQPYFAFSPDGRRFVFTDLGMGETGEEAVQLVTADVATGARTQATHLPPLEPLNPIIPPVNNQRFVANDTIGFWTDTLPDGSVFYTVKADGSEPPVAHPVLGPVEGSRLIPELFITAAATGVFVAVLNETPVNDIPGSEPQIQEIFAEHGTETLQLTSFRRSDTYGPLLDRDEQRVLFLASADPFGTNPGQNCQFFSVDTLGGDLRQVTRFGDGMPSLGGCFAAYRPGCYVEFGGQITGAGPDSLYFYSTCDPLGTNPDGAQLFAMSFDGTGLRQLTHTRGVENESDGSVTVELPGPYSHRLVGP